MNKNVHFDGGMLFCGANSGAGFVGYYKEIFKNAEKVYIMKGGPGTGKSSFLRQAAEYARNKGRMVEYYACSSDPDSLDAVVVDGKIAIADGTFPHVLEPKLAGAKDEIIDLGRFWNPTSLRKRYEDIERLSREKAECFEFAYRYLGAAKNVRNINRALILPCVKKEKAEKAAQRIFGDIKKGGGHEKIIGMTDSYGMKGRTVLDTYEFFAETVYVVEDRCMTAPIFLQRLYDLAQRSDTPVIVSYDPLDIESIVALFFPNDKKAFVIRQKGEEYEADVRINMQRFIDVGAVAQIRREYKQNEKHFNSLISSATDRLAAAGKCHFSLEKIYSSNMDFSAKEAYCNKLLERIFA